MSPVGGTARWHRGGRDSPAACGEGYGELAVPLEPMEDCDVDYADGGV